jgi:hypothetical protein
MPIPLRLSFATLICFSSACSGEAGFSKQPGAVRLESAEVAEASGLAASSRADGFWWMLNDGGGQAALFLAGTDGTDRGSVRVENARNTDWESLDSFTWEGKPWLLIADVGDNAARRDSCSLLIVPEPELPGEGKKITGSVTPGWTIQFRYPDGPRDCEAVAVDAARGKVLLISKRTVPPEVYELPLVPEKGATIVAERVGQTEVKPPRGGLPHPYAAQPTGMCISPDGSTAAVLSYIAVFLFPRKADESWATAFARAPLILERHGLTQAEALAFSRDGKELLVASEGQRPPLVRYALKPGAPN